MARKNSRNASNTRTPRFKNGDTRFFRDLPPDMRMLLLLQAYNEAHCELLEATGPFAVRATGEANVVEIEIAAFQTTSTLTASIEQKGEKVCLEPIGFRTRFELPWYPDFTYEMDRLEAGTIRLMTCWLEKTFLVHQDRILEQLRAMAAGATPRPV
jgi:hypothetical protein